MAEGFGISSAYGKILSVDQFACSRRPAVRTGNRVEDRRIMASEVSRDSGERSLLFCAKRILQTQAMDQAAQARSEFSVESHMR